MLTIRRNPPKFENTIKVKDGIPKKNEINTIIKVLLKKELFEPELIIDFSDIPTLTANDLSILVHCKQYADRKGVKFIFKDVSPALYAFFELTRMAQFFSYSHFA